jgi:hypothetical protein
MGTTQRGFLVEVVIIIRAVCKAQLRMVVLAELLMAVLQKLGMQDHLVQVEGLVILVGRAAEGVITAVGARAVSSAGRMAVAGVAARVITTRPMALQLPLCAPVVGMVVSPLSMCRLLARLLPRHCLLQVVRPLVFRHRNQLHRLQLYQP